MRLNLRFGALLLAVVTLFDGCDILGKKDFISVRESHLYAGDEPYYFAGTNFWYGPYLASDSNEGGRERLVRELDALRAVGITNLRILAGSERSYMSGMLSPSMQTAPREYNEDLLRGLDFLLSEMAERDMRGVLFLTNYWEWSGGMAQYVTWASGKESGADPQDPDFSWGAFMDYAASFYGDSVSQATYQNYVRHIVRRVNTVSGIAYREDPTIMAWELANEPRPGTVSERGENNLPYYYVWIDSTAKFVKSLDHNHLVTSGSEGIIGSLVSADVYKRAHSSPAIDYITVHVWPYNWKWFDPQDPAGTLDSAEIKSLDYLQEHFPIARELHKPIVVEEFGLTRDSMLIGPASSDTARARFYQALLAMVYDSAATGAPIAGSNFWAWAGEARAQSPDGKWRDGDPFMGDPPHEAQGLNSVFDTDSATIGILRDHAARMRALENNFAQSSRENQ